jgi:gamma-glutamyltranspeptidase
MRPKLFLSVWYIWRKRASISHQHKHLLQSDRNKILDDPRHLGVPSVVSKTMDLSCVKISTISKQDQNKLPVEPRDLGVPLGAGKTISEPMVRLVQTVHLSCTDTNNVSKLTETRLHMTHVTYEFHWVHPKLFLSLWYV